MDNPKIETAKLIYDVIKNMDITQTQASKILGITQSKVSALMLGKLINFSLERFFTYLNKLGYDVQVIITPAKSEKGNIFIKKSFV